MVRRLSGDDFGVSSWVWLVVVIVVVLVIVGVYFVYLVPKPVAAPLHVQSGDTIDVAYIGTFQDTGVLFDTSIKSIAQDNATYPKAVTFSWRSSWNDLSFAVGANPPAVIKGFDQGVRGLTEGQSATITISPQDGYGAANPSQIFVHSLLESVPARTTWNQSAFVAYFGQSPISGTVIADPVYGWDDSVSVVNSIATVTASPAPGQAIRPYRAWSANVVSIDDTANNGTGVVWIQNHLSPTQVDLVGGTTPDGKKFYLSAVNPNAETYTLNFNRQVVGRTLVFQITIDRISRPY